MKRFFAILTALLVCLSALPAAAAGSAQLSLKADKKEGYGGDIVTLSLNLTASAMGGLQTTIVWNTDYLTYIDGSAAFSADFANGAAVKLINDSNEGSIQIVYGNINGYSGSSAQILTAQFRLNDDISGKTNFALKNTKMTDASASAGKMSVTTGGASVQTKLYAAGEAYLSIEPSTEFPYVGSEFSLDVKMNLSSRALGSVQGAVVYDPEKLEYVSGSCSFSDAWAGKALMQIINDTQPGKITFVYASTSGVTAEHMLALKFKPIGMPHEHTVIELQELKATNADASHLAMMNCYGDARGIWPQPMAEQVYLSVDKLEEDVEYGDVVTVALQVEGVSFGGMQATLKYDAEALEYVPGSAGYSDAFGKNAAIAMVNDATVGRITLLYSNTNGYSPDGGAIFTAQFKARSIGKVSAPVQLSGVKLTTASAENLYVIHTECLPAAAWNIAKATYDMTNAAWDYAGPFEYDSTEKSVAVTGLPEGVTVYSYAGNRATECGDYTASVKFSYDAKYHQAPSMPPLDWRIVYPAIDSFEIDQREALCLVGETLQLTITMDPYNEFAHFTWRSSDPAVATVSEKGLVRGLKPGEVTITAQNSNGMCSDTRIVVKHDAAELQLSRTQVKLASEGIGSRIQLKSVLLPEGCAEYDVHWQSSDETVVRVQNGMLIAVGEGSAQVSATTGRLTAVCEVEVAAQLQQLSLPAELTRIDEEAFAGNPVAEVIVLPEGVQSIGDGAFRGCGNLRFVYVPEAVASIGEDAFALCPEICIIGKAGSAAERYANINGLEFMISE